MYFLDTNICIYYLKGAYSSIRENLLSTPPNKIKIPVIVHSELWYGVYKSQRREENTKKLREFLMPFDIIGYSVDHSETYAEIRTASESKGFTIGPNDLLIATITMANNGILVTRNTKEFSRIEGLKVTEW